MGGSSYHGRDLSNPKLLRWLLYSMNILPKYVKMRTLSDSDIDLSEIKDPLAHSLVNEFTPVYGVEHGFVADTAIAKGGQPVTLIGKQIATECMERLAEELLLGD